MLTLKAQESLSKREHNSGRKIKKIYINKNKNAYGLGMEEKKNKGV
jgi:hypothetical protein